MTAILCNVNSLVAPLGAREVRNLIGAGIIYNLIDAGQGGIRDVAYIAVFGLRLEVYAAILRRSGERAGKMDLSGNFTAACPSG
jgi:hypothetical protein